MENKVYLSKKPNLPVQITETDNTIGIDAYVSFSKELNDVADDILAGIKKYWEGTYNGKKLSINFIKKEDYSPAQNKKQRFFKIKKTGLSRTSFVLSSPIRWIWGFFKNFHFESFGLNWSPKYPGTIYLNSYSRRETLYRVASHEFGHILGLGDAYGARYRFGYEAPGTENYMMNHNWAVSEEEVKMVLNAHKTGRMQYFPVKFQLKTFLNTFVKYRK